VQVNPLLSIVIPTYNRADFLDYCLEVNIPLAKAHNIQIVISDNASTDLTAAVVQKRSKEYPLIDYHRSESNVGPDVNFERALNYSRTDYVWLLGDTYQIKSEGIDYILDLISANLNKYDVIVCNNNRVRGIPQQDYVDQNKLLSDLGWHMTLMASLVYSSQLIANADFSRYRDTNFIQTGIVFESLANKKFCAHWAEHVFVKVIRIKGVEKISWQDQTVQIWVGRWANFIFSLPPSYRLPIKLKCIKEHGTKTKLFTLKKLFALREADYLNYEVWQQVSAVLPFTVSRLKTNVFRFIALLPRSVATGVRLIFWPDSR